MIGAVKAAELCQVTMPKMANQIQAEVFSANDIKAQFRTAVFGSNPEIEVYHRGGLLLSFTNKASANSIATEFNRGDFPGTRQAYENAFQRLSFKIWNLEQAKADLVIDLSQLKTISGTFGKCYADIASLDAIIIEKAPEPIKTQLPPPEPLPAPVVDTTPPDRSNLIEKRKVYENLTNENFTR